MAELEQDLRRAFELEIKKKVDDPLNKATIFAARRTYEMLTTPGFWPVDTYWSIANHRISITGQDINLLRPETKPKQKGALASQAASVRTSELAKLDRLKGKPRKTQIIIGNPVRYAADVGGVIGKGTSLYITAAEIAEAETQIFIGQFSFPR